MPTRVLVADDHLAIREGIRSLLAPDDELLVVGEAADGVQASRMALELKPDLILLDNSMPGKTGLEVARELRPLLPDASIVFLTLDPGIRDLALAVGAVAHISKDTAPQETLRILRQVALNRAQAKPAELTAIERTLAGALVEDHLFTNDQMARLVASRQARESLAAALIRTGLTELCASLAAAAASSTRSIRPLPRSLRNVSASSVTWSCFRSAVARRPSRWRTRLTIKRRTMSALSSETSRSTS